LPQDVLTKVDRMTMAHSVEARRRCSITALLNSRDDPCATPLKDGTTKYLFKKALRGVLPDHIIDRKKQDSRCRSRKWIREDLWTFAHDVLLSPSAARRGVFNLSYIEHLLQLHNRAAISTCSCDDPVDRAVVPPLHGSAAAQRHEVPSRALHLHRGEFLMTNPRVAIVAASLDILGARACRRRSSSTPCAPTATSDVRAINPRFPRPWRACGITRASAPR
jgi:hypothetical protein